MSESLIESAWDERSDSRKRRRVIRRRLVKGDWGSRPSFLWRTVATAFARFGKPSKTQQQKAQAWVEGILWGVAWSAWIGVVCLAVAGGIWGPFMLGHIFWGTTTVAVGIALLFLVMIDLGSYRPRLFAQCLGPPKIFFHSLAKLSPEMEDQVCNIENDEPDSWRDVKDWEQILIAESTEFVLPDGIRTRIILRMLHRLAAIVASLALVGFGLSSATDGSLLAVCGHAVHDSCVGSPSSMPEHIYFSVDAFFTGFSDIRLVHNGAGYAYLTLIVISFTAVVYFFLTEVVASQSEFRANMRSAAESFVLQESTLR
jgi:hypothetical protein